MGKYRACEVCGKDDIVTHVVNSAIGPMSENTCYLCMAMNACDKELANAIGADSKSLTSYDSVTDSYHSLDGELIPIVTKSGRQFTTRTEYVEYVLDSESC